MELMEFEFLEISPEGRRLAVWGIFPTLCRQSLGQDRAVMVPSGCRWETALITQLLTRVSAPVQALSKAPKAVVFPGAATWLLPLFKIYPFFTVACLCARWSWPWGASALPRAPPLCLVGSEQVSDQQPVLQM